MGGVPESPLLRILRGRPNVLVWPQTSPSPGPQPSLPLPLAHSYGLLSLGGVSPFLWNLAGYAGDVWEGTMSKTGKRMFREDLRETPGILSGDCPRQRPLLLSARDRLSLGLVPCLAS